jgi:putative tryptophan/tyrosine transport system substrate-binding protein
LVKRRDFLRLAMAAAAGWSGPAAAQGRERIRTLGLLVSLPLNDLQWTRIPITQGNLARLGWIEGRTVRYEIRSSHGGGGVRKTAARELVSLNPDAIIASSTPDTAALMAETRTIPIVFATAADPVGHGFVESLARPGGNVTGFTNSDAEMGTKWLQFIKEIDPRITRVGVLFNPQSTARAGRYFLEPIETAAATIGVAVTAMPITDAAAIDPSVASLAGEAPGGLILPPDSFTVAHRQAIVAAAARHRVPAIYPLRYFIDAGGLFSYGAGLEVRDAEYVDLIFRGAKVADLPVQSPRKYELLINLKAAEALGLKLPLTLLARADQIIE